jgi:hypothetical protein
LSEKNRGENGEKDEKALWKKSSACLTTKPVPVFPVIPVVPASSEFNSRLGLTQSMRGRTSLCSFRPRALYVKVEKSFEFIVPGVLMVMCASLPIYSIYGK